MKEMKRIFVVVVDSLGIGAAMDAATYGDVGADTLGSIARHNPNLQIPNLQKLGLCNLHPVEHLAPVEAPLAKCAVLHERSIGKDTMTGHWEMMGLHITTPFQTFTETGFPPELIQALEEKTGRTIIGNKSASGTEILDELATEELEKGHLIVYTSADSVLQICGSEEAMGIETLYQYCEIARKMLVDDLAVGRVIARPFVGTVGNFTRTANRHDYALSPTKDTVLDALKAKGLDVIGVGKIYDIFNGRGITESIKSKNNQDGMAILTDLQGRGFHGLCFANLVDFDMVYGHRRDIAGYAQAVTDFDVLLSQFIENMDADDLLMITADHGCDPAFIQTTDHTREDVPLLMYSPDGSQWSNLGTIYGFDYVADVIRKELIGL